jgi:hypothetical protein
MVLLKTPLALFVLLGLALFRSPRPWPLPLLRFWLVPGLVHLAFFSLLVAPQNGVRYVLPTVVSLVLVAAAASRPGVRTRPLVLVLLGAWYALSSLSYLPHPMCYFNELVGRRIHAYRFLADSNLDWEDRRAEIARYMRRHPELKIDVEPERLHPGYILLGANRLLGISSPETFRPLRRLEPVDHVGYSFLLFDVRPADLMPRSRQAVPGDGRQ